MARKVWIMLFAALIGGGLAMRAVADDQEKKEEHEGHKHVEGEGDDHGEHGMDHAAMEKMWKEMGKPGPEHELLKEMVGKWKVKMTDYMQNPGEPTVTDAVSEVKMILDGRFAKESYKCEYEGEQFEGMGLFGYDRFKKKYVSMWMSNMGTGVMVTEGTYDEPSKTLTLEGTSATPMGEMKSKIVSTTVNDDKTTVTIYHYMPDEMKAMEFEYTRM